VGWASRTGAPATATVITGFSVAIFVIYLAAFHANAEDSFAWSGTIGTLILLVAYVLATIGCIMLVFVRRKLPVPMWQAVVPLLALVVLGYTLYRNVIPYPPSGPGRWFPVVSGGWLVVALVAVIVAPGFARRLGAALTASEGIAAGGPATAPEGRPASDAAGGHASSA
jgi:amino acid transporter